MKAVLKVDNLVDEMVEMLVLTWVVWKDGPMVVK
jgi:hypothetical protein